VKPHRIPCHSPGPTARPSVLDNLDGRTHAEVAVQLGINPLTVRTRLHRARALLREALAPSFEPGDTRTAAGSDTTRVESSGRNWTRWPESFRPGSRDLATGRVAR
jgi:hypothetical protein